MQTHNKANTAIDLLSTSKKQTPKKGNSSNNGEFLNMVLSVASEKSNSGKSITEKEIKDIVKSVSMQSESLKKAQSDASAKIANEIVSKLDDATKNELYENANFMQLLQVLEILNGGEQVSKFPNFTDKIANFLSNVNNVVQLSEVKSVSELIDLAKEFDLGLENITITQEDVENLGKMFKNLGKNEFFTPVMPEAKILSNELKTQVETIISAQNESEEEPLNLNNLLKEISKPQNNEKVATQIKPQIKQEPTQTVTDLIVDTNENADENTKPIQAKTNLLQPKEQKINLQSLLYPEREKAQNLTQQSEPKTDENELNLLVRDIAKNAQSQVLNKTAVRETLSNFSQNLADQIANYKAPFTRFNITLNPLNLGEVEITMLNRGNNLHINFNSTTTTMNLFLQNQAEFKNSLVNMGFTELEMNFSDQSQKQEQGRKTYQNNAKSNILSDEQNEEMASLELVIPRYI
ncbi:flagellar hook-length control protein FliK [Campylobacter majalis]|uniref:flagellar hook-length control protein FliK n=1 Tax=Campylobacter majalis TaxID=2790656 RepID=UPI003D699D7F